MSAVASCGLLPVNCKDVRGGIGHPWMLMIASTGLSAYFFLAVRNARVFPVSLLQGQVKRRKSQTRRGRPDRA